MYPIRGSHNRKRYLTCLTESFPQREKGNIIQEITSEKRTKERKTIIPNLILSFFSFLKRRENIIETIKEKRSKFKKWSFIAGYLSS